MSIHPYVVFGKHYYIENNFENFRQLQSTLESALGNSRKLKVIEQF